MMPALGAGGRWFESGRPHSYIMTVKLNRNISSGSIDMSDDALLIAEKIFRGKIKAINLYKSQGKKHPKLRKDDSIREFANACKASGMASSEISSDMKSRFKDLIDEGMLSSESIDKALGHEFKNHNLARERKTSTQTSGCVTSGYMAGSSGNTNTTNLINGISRSGLEDILATPVTAPEELSAINEKASSGTETITNNSSSVIYTSGSNEIYTPEAPGTVPIIRVVPGTPTFSGRAITSIGGLVTAAAGTVLLTANEVSIADDPQVLAFSGLLPSSSGILLPAVRDNNDSMKEFFSELRETLKPVGPWLADEITSHSRVFSSQTSSGHRSSSHTGFSAAFSLPKDSERRSGVFWSCLG